MKHLGVMICVGWAGLVLGMSALADEEMPRPSIQLKPDKLEWKKGESLSDRALVIAPLPIKNVISWSWETRRHRNRLTCMTVDPDGKLIATGGYDGTARLWDVETGKLVKALIGHDSYIYGIDFSPDGSMLATTGSFDQTVRIWDVKTGLTLRVLRGHPSYVMYLAWSPDAKTIAVAGGESGDASLFDLKTGKITSKVSLGQPVQSLSWHTDSQNVAMISRGQSGVAVWDTSTGKLVDPFGELASTFLSTAYSPDGKYLAAGDAKNVTIFDAESRKEIMKLDGGGNSLAWSNDSTWLASGSVADNTLRIYDVKANKPVQSGPAAITQLQFAPDKSQIHSTNMVALFRYEIQSGKLLANYEVTGVDAPRWNPGRPLITGMGTDTLTLWDNSTGKQIRELKGHTAAITDVEWSPDGKWLASGSTDKSVRIWDANEGKQTQLLNLHQAKVNSIAWAPDGKSLASAGADKKVIVWEPTTGKMLQTLTDHTQEVSVISWSPSIGNAIATGGKDRVAHIYNTKTWKKTRTIEDKTDITVLTWSNDGKFLGTGHTDSHLRLWNVTTGKSVGDLTASGSPPNVNAAAWSPNGAYIVMGMANHTAHIWNPRGQRLHYLQTMAPVQQLAWGSGGAVLGIASADRTTRFFDPTNGRLRGVYIAEDAQIIAISAEGHYRAEGEAIEEIIAVVQTETHQETYTASEFAEKMKWKNNPALTKFTTK